MRGDTRCQHYALDVSEPLFRLATESVRLYSNEKRQLRTLEDLVNERSASLLNLDHNPETVRMHLRAVPTVGDVRIDLAVDQVTEASLTNAKKALKTLTGADVSLGDFLSILLFDYVVEQKANRVKAKLGLPAVGAVIESQDAGAAADDNVIRLK
jgi:hypothetical protein